MQFKFLCLNLWYGGRLFDSIVEFLRRENADVLALQEVYHGDDPALDPQFRSFTELPKVLGYPHTHIAPAFRDVRPEGKIVQGNAIFSRFPIVATNVTFYDVPYNHERSERADAPDFSRVPRNLQHAVLDVGGTLVNVLNTQGIWGFDAQDNERRLHMAEVIAGEVCGRPHTVLAGDFNVGEHTKSIATLEACLSSVFKDQLTTSFNLVWKTDPGFARSVVDMVFASPDMRILDRRVPDANVSDHRPLVCVLEIT